MYTNVTKHTEMKYKLHIYMQARMRAVGRSTRLVVVVVVVIVLLLFPDKGDVGGIGPSGGDGGIGHRQSGVGVGCCCIIGGGVGRQGK